MPRVRNVALGAIVLGLLLSACGSKPSTGADSSGEVGFDPGNALALCSDAAVASAVSQISGGATTCSDSPRQGGNTAVGEVVAWRTDWTDPSFDPQSTAGTIVIVTYVGNIAGSQLLESEMESYRDSSNAPYKQFTAGGDSCWEHWFAGGDVDCVRGHFAVHVSSGSAADPSRRSQFVAVVDAIYGAMGSAGSN